MNWLRQHLREQRVIAVLRAPTIAAPGDLVRALVESGFRTVEFTFTTAGVLSLIEEAARVDDAVIAAGSVTTSGQARRAHEAGARFIVSPSDEPEVATCCRELGVPYVPGALTPNEVRHATIQGADVVKLFPVRTLGPSYVADLLAPLPDVALVPSGGIGIDDASDYLAAGAIAVGTGALATTEMLVSGDIGNLRARAGRLASAVALTTSELR